MQPSTLAHFAINATDLEQAQRFYRAVFGWTFAAWGPPGFYQIEGAGVMGALHPVFFFMLFLLFWPKP